MEQRLTLQCVIAGSENSGVLLCARSKNSSRAHQKNLKSIITGKYYLKRLTEELSEADYRELGARNNTLHAWAVRLQLGGRPPELRFSEIFSADMERRLEDFPNWRAKAEKMLPS